METLPDRRFATFIRRHHVLSLGTHGGDGMWCAAVFYAYVAERNVFVYSTDPETRHGRDALTAPSVSASIVLETRAVGRLQGVQISGRTWPTDDLWAKEAYLRRFPFSAAMRLDLWILSPEHMKLTDNTLGFGQKLTWNAR